MSDLKPVIQNDGDPVSVESAAAASAYPYPVVRGGRQLLLYFEVYHLTVDGAGEARYEVEYTVRPEGGRESEISSVTTGYRNRGGTGEEIILLDLAEWRESGAIDVEVRVRDSRSLLSVERRIRLYIEA